MTGKQEGPYKGEETTAEEDKVWQCDGKEPAFDWCLDCRGQVQRIITQVIVIFGTWVLMTGDWSDWDSDNDLVFC